MTCPICKEIECPGLGYPLLWSRYEAGQNRDHWRRIHDKLNKPLIYPSFARQASNAMEAAAKFLASGFETVDDAEQDRRLDICRSCEFFDAPRGKCSKCGCFANLKARVASQHCPLPEPKW